MKAPHSQSSDDDLLDIQHTGTTGEISHRPMENGGSGHDGGINSGPDFGGVSGGVFANTGPGDEFIPPLGQYDDFHTIDWLRDIARDRMRHRYIVKRKKESLLDMLRGAHDAWSGEGIIRLL